MKNKLTCLTIIITTLSVASCGDATSKKVYIPKTSTGYVTLGRIEESDVAIYSVNAGYDTPACEFKSSHDSDILARAGVVSVPKYCYPDDEDLYLVVASGGNDVDVNNDGVIDAQPTAMTGTLHAIVRADDFKHSNWHLSQVSELVYQRLKGALGARVPIASVLAEADRVAAQLLSDVNGDNIVDYADVMAWSARDLENFIRDPDSLNTITQAIRENLDTITDDADVLTSEAVSSFATLGSGYVSGKAIAIQDDIVYLADGDRGVAVVDVSNPGSPTLIAIFDPKASHPDNTFANTPRIVVDDDLAALSLADQGVALLDISDPENIQLIKILDTVNATGELVIANNHLFVQSASQVYVYTLSDPANSTLIDTSSIDHIYAEVADIVGMGAYDNVLYVMWNLDQSGASTFDISDPSAITPIDNDPQIGALLFSFSHYTFMVSDGYLFESGFFGETSEIQIYDIDNAVNSGFSQGTATSEKTSIAIANKQLFWADGSDGLGRVNINDISAIRVQPNKAIKASEGFSNSAYYVKSYKGYLYVATEYGLEVYNISNARDPQAIANIQLSGYAYDVSANSTTLAVGNYHDIEVFDIASLPTIGASRTLDNIDEGRSVALYEDAAFALNMGYSSPTAQVIAFDSTLTNSSIAPALADDIFRLGSISYNPGDPGEHHVFTRWNDHLLLATVSGFFDIDITTPLAPSVERAITSAANSTYCTNNGVACTYASFPAFDISAYDGIVYGRIGKVVNTLDLSDNLSFQFSPTSIGNSEAIEADAQYLYSATTNSVEIYDRSTLTLITTLAVDSYPRVLLSNYPQLFVMHRDKVTVYDVSVFPAVVTDEISTNYAGNIALQNGYLFIVEGYNGLTIVALNQVDVP